MRAGEHGVESHFQLRSSIADCDLGFDLRRRSPCAPRNLVYVASVQRMDFRRDDNGRRMSHTQQTNNNNKTVVVADVVYQAISVRSSRDSRQNCIPGRRLRLIVLTQVLTSSRCIAQSRRPDGPTARPTPESAERSPHSSAFNPPRPLPLLLLLRLESRF